MNSSELHLINARLPLLDENGLYELKASDGSWTSIALQQQGTIPCADSFLPMDEWFSKPFNAGSDCALDLQGRVLIPGMVDAHMHLDKAYSLAKVGNRSGTLHEAITNYRAAVQSFTKEELKNRIRKAALRALSFGTTALRSHLDFPVKAGRETAFRAVHAALEVKEELQGVLQMQFFPMCPYDKLTKEEMEMIEEALKLGMDGVGGAPHLSMTPEEDMDLIFALAAKYGKPVDLHADESDDPTIQTIAYIAEKTIEYGYQGRVTVGHLCSLSAIDQARAGQLIERMADARLGAVTLPAVNLYLQGRGDQGLIRRGTTRVKELLNAGIALAAASDNIQDPFHPFGKGDLLQIALITGYAAHLGSPADQLALLRMVTETPASILGLGVYGIFAGASADFVVLDARSAHELLTEQPSGRAVYRGGRWVYASAQTETWGSNVLDRLASLIQG